MGRSGGPAALELAPACALTTVAAFGLVGATALWSVPVFLVVLLTSPLLRSGNGIRLFEAHHAEQAELRRRFDEIVAHGFASDRADDDRPGPR